MDPDLNDIVVCFMVSGDARYVAMTLQAVRSFQQNTPNIAVGLLVEPGFDHGFFVAQLPNPATVHVKHFTKHFDWNPTQHKLDIALFTDKFKTIFWLDSDVIVHRDLTGFFLAFHQSNKQYAFTPDHVNHDEDFRRRWPGNRDTMFIPQACFMGFKAEIIKPFFQEWENIWKEWITPFPFSKYPDPNPSFPNSQFCIEQYALGMAIEKFIENIDFQVFLIPREQMFVKNVYEAIEAVSGGAEQLALSFSGLSLASQTFGVSSYRPSSYRSSSYGVSSYRPSSYGVSSYRPTSYGVTSYRPTSYGVTSYRTTSYGVTSYRTTSYGVSSYRPSSYGVSSYRPSSYGVSSYGVSSYGVSSYRQSSYGVSSSGATGRVSSAPLGTQQTQGQVEGSGVPPPGEDRLMVDHFVGGVVHYYSVNFEPFFTPEQQQQQQQQSDQSTN